MAIAHLEVALKARDPNGSPDDAGAVEFTYAEGKGTTPNVTVNCNGDIELKNVKKESVKLVFELKTQKLTWNGTEYEMTFTPNDPNPNNGRSLLLIEKRLGSNPKKQEQWSYTDQEFDHFATGNNGKLLTVDMANKAKDPQGNPANYNYTLVVRASGGGKIHFPFHDPQIKNGGNNRVMSWPILQTVLNIMFAVALTYLVGVRFGWI